MDAMNSDSNDPNTDVKSPDLVGRGVDSKLPNSIESERTESKGEGQSPTSVGNKPVSAIKTQSRAISLPSGPSKASVAAIVRPIGTVSPVKQSESNSRTADKRDETAVKVVNPSSSSSETSVKTVESRNQGFSEEYDVDHQTGCKVLVTPGGGSNVQTETKVLEPPGVKSIPTNSKVVDPLGAHRTGMGEREEEKETSDKSDTSLEVDSPPSLPQEHLEPR